MRARSAAPLVLAAALSSATAASAKSPPPLPTASAAPGATAPSDLTVEAFPVFGSNANVAQGWIEIAVRITNKGQKPARGQVAVSMVYIGRGKTFRADAPFSVGGGASVNVRVPAQVSPYGDLVVTALDEDQNEIAATRFPAYSPAGLTLLDVSETSRLHAAIQDAVVTPLAYVGGSRSSTPTVSVAVPRFDAATGDPILPDRAALYTGADAVLLRSEVLARLDGAELAALAGFVLGGGTVAVAITRPEDLRHPTITALAGGPITRQGVSAATLQDFSLPAPSATLSPSAKQIASAHKPAGEVAEALSGFTGGNLHGSLYGASATYGLGEVHLLAFDPTRQPAVDDPWAQARMVDLTRRAYDRRTSVVFRPGSDPTSGSYSQVRRQLDPNESSRWAIGAAAALLCVYAIVAGPVSFSLATRAGKPLRALRWLPLFSAIAFALVVAIGVVTKGVSGRARHLTLIEAGAGMSKGTARRFRGFYASRAKELTVRTTDASSVVSAAVLPEYAEHSDHLVVDREGARLVEVAALPWQTVVVREDGFASIGDGVALVKDPSGGVAVVNRSGRDLRAAILRTPDGAAHYFQRIKDGDRVVSAPANAIGKTPDGKTWEGYMLSAYRAGSINVHRLSAHALHPVVDPDAPGLVDAWNALEDAAPDMVDWFPDDVPTLIGQLDGGEGRTSDAGLRLETDRLLIRVVGFGGRP